MEATPADALAAVIRKRRRRAEPEEPETDFLTNLAPEVQLRIVERLESAHEGAEPIRSAKLAEAKRVLRAIYRTWIDDRRIKIDRPPDAFSLALARLFVSPRWKLLTHLPWTATAQILEAHERSPVRGISKILFLYKIGRRGWRTTLASIVPRFGSKSRDVVDLAATTAVEIPTRLAFYDEDSLSFSADLASGDATLAVIGDEVEVEISALVIYGSVESVLDPGAYDVSGAIEWSVHALRNSFFGISKEGFAPKGLAWKNQVVLVLATGYPHSNDEPLHARVFFERGGASQMHVVALHDWGTRTIGETLGEAVRKALEEDPTGDRSYVRTEIVWFNGATTLLHDASKGFAMDESSDGDAIRAAFRDAKEPELESLYPKAGDRGGYEMSMFMPAPRDSTPVGGTLIIPLPWFMFKMRRMDLHRSPSFEISFARMRFGWNINKIQIFSAVGDNPLNYAPYELIWLPDDISDAELSDLTMLQRRDIPERATAHLDVEPL